jgi:hypothetical protein
MTGWTRLSVRLATRGKIIHDATRAGYTTQDMGEEPRTRLVGERCGRWGCWLLVLRWTTLVLLHSSTAAGTRIAHAA